MSRGTPLDNNILHGPTVRTVVANTIGRFFGMKGQRIIVSYECTYTLSLAFPPEEK